MSFADTLQEKLGEHDTSNVNILNIYNKPQIQELVLDDISKADELTEDHQKTIEKYSSLVRLTINNWGLSSLKNFPQLKTLQIVSKYNFIYINKKTIARIK